MKKTVKTVEITMERTRKIVLHSTKPIEDDGNDKDLEETTIEQQGNKLNCGGDGYAHCGKNTKQVTGYGPGYGTSKQAATDAAEFIADVSARGLGMRWID